MNKIILTSFTFLSILSIAASININCSFQNCGFYVISSTYSCIIQSTSSHENAYASITGSHSSGKTNNDVIGLYGNNFGHLEKFPKGLDKVFENLKAIYTRSGGQIRELHQEDLKPMPNLVEFLLDGNKIEIVEKGLFDHNPNLEAVSFYANPILYIDTNVFDNLSKLRYYWMNGCANVFTENNRAKVLSEITRAKSLCQGKHTEPTTTTTQAPIIIKQNCSEISSKDSGKDFLTLNEKLDYLITRILDLDAKFNNMTQTSNEAITLHGHIHIVSIFFVSSMLLAQYT